MLNPQEIHKQAEKERQKQALKEAGQNPVKEPAAFTPLPAGSWPVFHRIYPRAAGFSVWILLPWALAITGWLLVLIDNKQFGWIIPWAAALTVLPIAAYLAQLAREIVAYRAYRSWIKNPGFTVNGWNRLGQAKHFPALLYWDGLVRLTIQVQPATTGDTIKLINDVLYLFTNAATKTFYTAWKVQPGASGDRRKKWTMNSALTAEGSANSDTMGLIYFLLKNELRSIQQQTNAVEAVNITFSNEVFEVKPVPAKVVNV